MISGTANTAPTPGFEKPGVFDPNSICHVVFSRLLDQEVNRLSQVHTVLDIGCGSGIGRRSEPQEAIARSVKMLWGVEPDPEIKVPECFAQVWRSPLENADILPASVDLAYSFMVMEHVDDSVGFAEKLAQIIKPGGIFLGATINARCFFARVARFSSALGVQEQVLALARGKQAIEDYHYPAVYRMNTQDRLQELAEKCGFSRVEIFAIDSNEWFAYFPRPVRWFGHIVRGLFQRSPSTFPYLFVRMTR